MFTYLNLDLTSTEREFGTISATACFINPIMMYILYVYEQGQLSGLEVWGALGVKLQVLQLRARFLGETFRHNRIAQVVE